MSDVELPGGFPQLRSPQETRPASPNLTIQTSEDESNEDVGSSTPAKHLNAHPTDDPAPTFTPPGRAASANRASSWHSSFTELDSSPPASVNGNSSATRSQPIISETSGGTRGATTDPVDSSQQPPRVRRRARKQQDDHWTSRINNLRADHPLLQRSRPLPKPGHMLFASQRPIPPRNQTGPIPPQTAESPASSDIESQTADHPNIRTDVDEDRGAENRYDSNGSIRDDHNHDHYDEEDPTPHLADDETSFHDFLDDADDNQDKKRQYYWDDHDDHNDHVLRTEFDLSNKRMRLDMNTGFEEVLSAVRDVAGVVDHIASTLPPELTQPRSRPPTRKSKVTVNPVRRSAEKNTQARELREHLATLAGGKDKLLEPQVDQQEAEDFASQWDANNNGATTRPCCTAATFRIDILGMPRSPWNRSAARVFYMSFVPEAQRNPITMKEIEKAFFTRIKSINKDYKNARASSQYRLKIARIARKNTRKYLLFQRRHNIAQLIPQYLGHHVDMLERLGVDGMSSDESDSDDLPRTRRQRVKFKVLTPKWRNPVLSDWLHVFDMVYWVYRRDKGPTRGDHPRHRLYSVGYPRFSTGKKYVPGLPINTYNRTWLETRRDVEFAVCPEADVYDFSHGHDVTAYINALDRMDES